MRTLVAAVLAILQREDPWDGPGFSVTQGLPTEDIRIWVYESLSSVSSAWKRRVKAEARARIGVLPRGACHCRF
jgi:hypothetical protein